ncbi:protein of unknown function [Burkholderia multivorans]
MCGATRGRCRDVLFDDAHRLPAKAAACVALKISRCGSPRLLTPKMHVRGMPSVVRRCSDSIRARCRAGPTAPSDGKARRGPQPVQAGLPIRAVVARESGGQAGPGRCPALKVVRFAPKTGVRIAFFLPDAARPARIASDGVYLSDE